MRVLLSWTQHFPRGLSDTKTANSCPRRARLVERLACSCWCSAGNDTTSNRWFPLRAKPGFIPTHSPIAPSASLRLERLRGKKIDRQRPSGKRRPAACPSSRCPRRCAKLSARPWAGIGQWLEEGEELGGENQTCGCGAGEVFDL